MSPRQAGRDRFEPNRARGGRADRRDSSDRTSLSALLVVDGLGDDHGGTRLASDIDLELRAGLGALGRNVGHSDPSLQARREGAAGDLAAAGNWIALPRDAPFGQLEGNQALARTLRADPRRLVGADEPGALLAAPAKPGLDGASAFAQLVAVEAEADLEPERVARAEAGGRCPRVYQRVPHPGSGSGVEQQLEAVLAGVAGSAHQHRNAGHVALTAVHPRRQPPVGESG